MEEKDDTYEFKVNWKSVEEADDWTHFYFKKDDLTLVLFEHYFKSAHEDPWVAFDVTEPITEKDLSEDDFSYEECDSEAQQLKSQ